ncbi:MAG: argininosuccinate lyase, partial [Chloroflexota bacterium]|nr:argininosuccinate lyase [Chloroflexota bacterium]
MSRLDARLAPELINSAYWFETNDAPLSHHDLTFSDLAHLLHLSELELIPRADAQTLLRLHLELDQDARFAYDPAFGDAF